MTDRLWLGRFEAGELSNDAYHAAPGVSKTHLDVIANGSPRHYWQQYINPKRGPAHKTDALRVGDAIHSAILQPDLFASNFAAKPVCDKRTTEGKAVYAEFLRTKGNRIELSALEYEWCVRIRDSVYAHKIARGLLKGGKAEHSFFTKEAETGELVKCRPDYLHDAGDLIVDIKSTTDAHPDTFSKDATNYMYDLAVPWYFDIVRAVTGTPPRHWVWIVIEKEEPYAVGIYYAQKHDIIRARDTCRRYLMEIARQRKLGTWEDYGSEVRPLVMKPWARR